MGHRAEVLTDAALLVNTTSLGMKGQPELEIDLARLNSAAVVTDIVYTPLRTQLLIDAPQHAAIPWSKASACCCTRPCAASNCGSA
jgi:shikimate 5-dehydrogenase